MKTLIEETCKNCLICVKECALPHEPLMPMSRPTRPWQKIGTDIYEYKERTFLVAVDYFSRWLESAELPNASSDAVNGGPCFDSRAFDGFCLEMDTFHDTSSPTWLQCNGQSESGVKILKHLLSKNDGDLLKALHVYNSTPFRNGGSPAELFLGRSIRSNLPVHPNQLVPTWPNFKEVEQDEEKANQKMAMHYNKRHRTRDIPSLDPGDHVFVKKGKIKLPGEVVTRAKTPRSYYVRGMERFDVIDGFSSNRKCNRFQPA